MGLQSELQTETSPTVPGKTTSPGTWSIIWFVVAVLVVAGFHVRMFGHPVPPAAHVP